MPNEPFSLLGLFSGPHGDVNFTEFYGYVSCQISEMLTLALIVSRPTLVIRQSHKAE